MPGTFKNFFDLENYKTELGKELKKITLYLCTSSDLELSEELQNKTDCDESTE
jgi:hypothetical protein